MKRRVFLQSGIALAMAASPAVARPPFALYSDPVPLLSPPFHDGNGRKLRLGNFAGRIVLLNVWATWCPPCRDEMPTLDTLQALLGGKDFTVVPVSIDATGIEAARQFYREIGIRNLDLFWGEDLRIKLAFGVFGLPTTLLIDRNGQELSRVSGPAKWDGTDAVTQLARLIGEV